MSALNVPSWPRVQVTITPEGTGTVTINGNDHPLVAASVDEARDAARAEMTELAAKLERPIRALTIDPDGEWPIIVHPTGDVEEDERAIAAQPKRARAAAPRTTTVPAPASPPAVTQRPATPPPAAPAPAAVPEAFDRDPIAAPARASFLERTQTVDPATKGLRGRLNTLGLQLAPGAAEQSERADVRAVSQHWPGPRTIAVVNGKGGAGKTPTTILLSAVLARFGGAGVVAWDNNQTRGTLGWRTEQAQHESAISDLLPHVHQLLSGDATAADLSQYVHHQTADRYDVLRSRPMLLASENRLHSDDVDALHRVLSKYYRVIVMDSGNDESDPMWARMIDHADHLVIATSTRADHAEAGALLLEALAQRDRRAADLAAASTVVVSQADPGATRADVTAVAEGFQPLSNDVVTIPHDPAIGAGHLRYNALRPATQRAWLAAAAAVARSL